MKNLVFSWWVELQSIVSDKVDLVDNTEDWGRSSCSSQGENE